VIKLKYWYEEGENLVEHLGRDSCKRIDRYNLALISRERDCVCAEVEKAQQHEWRK
jgi:hypothetical protein